MEVIAGIVDWQKHFRVARIASRPVEVDHGIIRFARSDPLVERLALCFSDLGVISRTVERRQRCSKNLQPTRVRLLDKLLMASDEVFGRRGRVLSGIANVVDAFKHNDVRDAGLRQRVALETGERIDALSDGTDIDASRYIRFTENPISGDGGIENAELASLPQQPAGEMIRPAIIGI